MAEKAGYSSNRTLIPIHCRVVKDLSEFDGSWTMWESKRSSFFILIRSVHIFILAGLMDVIADKVSMFSRSPISTSLTRLLFIGI